MTLPQATAEVDDTLHRQQQEEAHARIASATSILALGNVTSRILGLAREMVLTFFFGASVLVDAFQVATIVIRAVYDLLIGGHVNGAFVPVLSEIVTLQGKKELWRVVSILISLTFTMLAVLTLLIYLFAPQIVDVTAGGASTETRQIATNLLRFTSPALIFMGLFAVLSGTLYALKQFTFPAFAGAIFNGAIVLLTVVFTPRYQVSFVSPQTFLSTLDYLSPLHIVRPSDGIVVVAVGWLVGAFAQMAVQMIDLRKAELRFTIHWKHPALNSILLLYAPVMLSLIMDTLIIRPFSYNLASQTGEGSIAYMNWATTLIQFPQGLVATAISIAILPTLASQAVLLDDTQRAFKETLGLGLRLTTTLIIPATLGLFVLGHPIIEMLFEHGAFTAKDTAITLDALNLYLIGLPFAAIDLLLVYAFYARKDTLTPTLIGIFSLLVYVITAILLLPHFGLFSLMIADSIKHIVHAVISAVILHRRVGGFSHQRLLPNAIKTLIAGIAMSIVALIITPFITQAIGSYGIIREAIIMGIIGAISGSVFVFVALVLGIEELRWLITLIRKRLHRA